MEAVPAATVVVVRPSIGDPLDVLMVHRSTRHAFAGMWAFPGGRVDPGDGAATDSDADRARHAAVREAREETGIELDPDALIAFAHWTPPPEAPRRFATWFFVVEASAGTVNVFVDGSEIVDHAWISPQAALDRHGRGDIQLATPTWVTLHELTQYPSAAEAVAAARRARPTHYATRITQADGTAVALWDGDAGYADGDTARPGPRHRLAMPGGGAWTFERSA